MTEPDSITIPLRSLPNRPPAPAPLVDYSAAAVQLNALVTDKSRFDQWKMTVMLECARSMRVNIDYILESGKSLCHPIPELLRQPT